METVGERTMVAIFDAITTGVGVVNTHARFVVSQMVAAFGVAGGAM